MKEFICEGCGVKQIHGEHIVLMYAVEDSNGFYRKVCKRCNHAYTEHKLPFEHLSLVGKK